MLADLEAISGEPRFDTDICIIGAGAAGITLAMELIPTGKKILLLEGGGMEYSEPSQSLYEMDVVSPRYESPAISRLRFLGGTTNHWAGSVRPFNRIDFERRSWVADSGWPFSYDELLPYYERAFVYLDVGPLYKDERPLTRHLHNLNDRFVAGGFVPSIGYHSPPTRFGTKYLDRLRTAPNLTLMINANLLSINEAANRGSVENLTICNYRGQMANVKARYYVIALGGIENARALLLSDSVTPGGIGNEYDVVGRYFMDHPIVKAMVFYPSAEFLGSWHGGRVRYQSVVHELSFSASESLLKEHQLTNARMPLDWATEVETSAGIEAAHQLEKAISDGIWLPNLLTHLRNILNDRDLIYEKWRRPSQPAKSRPDGYGGYVVDMMMEQRPDPDNRIVLTEKQDHLGLRRGKIFWRIQQQEKDSLKQLVNLFAKGFGAAGLGIVRSSLEEDDTGRRFHDLLNYGSHHMGTTRASSDPKKGVVDANQRIHGRANIYVAGSSIFPTGGHVPPTATIVATTIRLADHLRKRLV